jgi:hypothetical protein
MQKPRGKSARPSTSRKLVAELIRFAKQVPSIPLARDCRIPELIAARKAASPSPSWMAVFIKAFPYERIYEHPTTQCCLLIEREFEGEKIVLTSKIHTPDRQSIREIDAHIKSFREKPVLEFSYFRQLMRVGRLPWFLRRFVFWTTFNASGTKRAKRVGTFMISSLGNMGVEQIHPLTPLTTYFCFGPISDTGKVTLKIIYDHRIMDGRHVARALTDMERILNATILEELRGMATNGSKHIDQREEA